MSPRRRSLDGHPEAFVAEPILDDDERAESTWLLAREKNPQAPAPSKRVERDYAEIEDLLGTLPTRAHDERWQDEVLRLAASKRSPWWRRTRVRWAFSAAVAAAAVLVLSLWWPRTAELAVAIHRDGNVRDLDGVVVGDHLVVTARPRDGAGDLRVYLSDGTMVARCPHGTGCTGSAEAQIIDIKLEMPVQHQIILVVRIGDRLPDLPTGSMSSFLEAARAAGARIVLYPPIDVH